jgi:hypothetical protein
MSNSKVGNYSRQVCGTKWLAIITLTYDDKGLFIAGLTIDANVKHFSSYFLLVDYGMKVVCLELSRM